MTAHSSDLPELSLDTGETLDAKGAEDVLAKEVASIQCAFAALNQAERTCADCLRQMDSAASRVRGEKERLHTELARLQDGVKATADSKSTSTLRDAAASAICAGSDSLRSASRNCWGPPPDVVVPDPFGIAPKMLLPGAVESDEDDIASTRTNTERCNGLFMATERSLGAIEGPGPLKSPLRSHQVSHGGMASVRSGHRTFMVLPGGRSRLWRGTLFPDAAALKADMLKALTGPENNVRERYKHDGCAQRVARSPAYGCCVLGVACLSVVWLAVEAEHYPAEALYQTPIPFQLMEHFFCIFFAVDLLLVRLGAFQHKLDCLRDTWFKIDFLLLFVMVVETWILSIVVWVSRIDMNTLKVDGVPAMGLVRVLRLARMVRLFRPLRWLPGMTTLTQGAAAAAKPVFLALLLLFSVIYAFAVLFAQTAGDLDVGREHFDSVPNAMATLVLRGMIPDLADLIYRIGLESRLLALFLLLFTLLASLVSAQLLLGLLVHTVGAVAIAEREQLSAEFVRSRLLLALERAGHGVLGTSPMPLTPREFNALLQEPKVASVFQEMGVDPGSLADLAAHAPLAHSRCGRGGLFGPTGMISFHELLGLVLSLRSSNAATVQDLMDLRRFVEGRLGDHSAAIAQELKACLATRAPLPGTPRTAGVKLADEGGSDHTGQKPQHSPARVPAGGGVGVRLAMPRPRAARPYSAGSRARARGPNWQGTPASGYAQGYVGERPRSATVQGSGGGAIRCASPEPSRRVSNTQPLPSFPPKMWQKEHEGPFALSTLV